VSIGFGLSSYIYFPIENLHLETVNAYPKNETRDFFILSPYLSPQLCIIVQDGKSNLKVLKLILENESHMVTGPSTGKDFLLNDFKVEPDITFADIMLGDYHGIQLSNRLRTN